LFVRKAELFAAAPAAQRNICVSNLKSECMGNAICLVEVLSARETELFVAALWKYNLPRRGYLFVKSD
jgi:hypothetical protein